MKLSPALLVKCNIMSLENASCGSEHKCFGALDAHFIGYQHNAVLTSGRNVMLEGARMTPGNRYTYIIFIDNLVLFYCDWGGARNTFSLDMGALQK